MSVLDKVILTVLLLLIASTCYCDDQEKLVSILSDQFISSTTVTLGNKVMKFTKIAEYREILAYIKLAIYISHMGCSHCEKVRDDFSKDRKCDILGRCDSTPRLIDVCETKCRGITFFAAKSMNTRYCVEFAITWETGFREQKIICDGIMAEISDGIFLKINPIVQVDTPFIYNNYTCLAYTAVDTSCDDVVTSDYCKTCGKYIYPSTPKTLQGKLMDKNCQFPISNKPILTVLARSNMVPPIKDLDNNNDGLVDMKNTSSTTIVIGKGTTICSTNAYLDTMDEQCGNNTVTLQSTSLSVQSCTLLSPHTQYSYKSATKGDLFVLQAPNNATISVYIVTTTNEFLLNTCLGTKISLDDFEIMLARLRSADTGILYECSNKYDKGCLSRTNTTELDPTTKKIFSPSTLTPLSITTVLMITFGALIGTTTILVILVSLCICLCCYKYRKSGFNTY